MASKKNKIIISVRDNLLEAFEHIEKETGLPKEKIMEAVLKELDSWK